MTGLFTDQVHCSVVQTARHLFPISRRTDNCQNRRVDKRIRVTPVYMIRDFLADNNRVHG
jgi:hypothetical protein